MNKLTKISSAILLIGILILLGGCKTYIAKLRFQHEQKIEAKVCDYDRYNYHGEYVKYETIKLPNGALHYYVVDTVEIKNPVVVSLDRTSSFIMEDSVYQSFKPEYDKYIDNDFVYLFAGEYNYMFRALYPAKKSETREYTSRIDFFPFEGSYNELLWEGDKRFVKPNIVEIKGDLIVERWSNPPKRFVMMLIRGSSYRTLTYCINQVDYAYEVKLKPLPLKSGCSYYKMLYPIFE